MSLRARLMAGLLVLAAGGLVTLRPVTYTEQRSFLYDRADQQAGDVQEIVSHKLNDANANVAGYPPDQDDRFGGPQGGPGPGPHGNPVGYAVGQRLDANGNLVGKPVPVSLGGTTLATPKFPTHLA